MACDWHSDLFAAFSGSDSCLVVRNTETFFSRLEIAGNKVLPNWYFHHNPVEYFDPYERMKDERINPAMSKDFKFAYQREYRFLWFSSNGERPNGFKHLDLESLQDIGEVHAQP